MIKTIETEKICKHCQSKIELVWIKNCDLDDYVEICNCTNEEY